MSHAEQAIDAMLATTPTDQHKASLDSDRSAVDAHRSARGVRGT